VPGIAVAVVKDGELVFSGGWGQREVGKPEPVDGDTLFSIASITKAFTSASLSILADEGKLDLDDRVIDHLPWFRMGDAYVTREMRLRDRLVRRGGLGLGAGDPLFGPPTDYATRAAAARPARARVGGCRRSPWATPTSPARCACATCSCTAAASGLARATCCSGRRPTRTPARWSSASRGCRSRAASARNTPTTTSCTPWRNW